MQSRLATYEQWQREQPFSRKEKIWTLAVLLGVLTVIGLFSYYIADREATYEAWERTVTPEENARIDSLMSQVAEGSYGDLLLMKDGSVVALWNFRPLGRERGPGGGQAINACPSTNHECLKAPRRNGEWNRQKFSLVERLVKKNPDDPEWNRLAGEFLVQ